MKWSPLGLLAVLSFEAVSPRKWENTNRYDDLTRMGRLSADQQLLIFPTRSLLSRIFESVWAFALLSDRVLSFVMLFKKDGGGFRVKCQNLVERVSAGSGSRRRSGLRSLFHFLLQKNIWFLKDCVFPASCLKDVLNFSAKKVDRWYCLYMSSEDHQVRIGQPCIVIQQSR